MSRAAPRRAQSFTLFRCASIPVVVPEKLPDVVQEETVRGHFEVCLQENTIFMELMTSDRKLKASREGSPMKDLRDLKDCTPRPPVPAPLVSTGPIQILGTIHVPPTPASPSSVLPSFQDLSAPKGDERCDKPASYYGGVHRLGTVAAPKATASHSTVLQPCSRFATNLTPVSIYDKYSAGPSIRPICTRCCLTMTDVIQACGNFR